MAIASAIAKSGDAALPWSEAQRVIMRSDRKADATRVDWLVRADLLLKTDQSSSLEERCSSSSFERFVTF